jgi:hypothetical protein
VSIWQAEDLCRAGGSKSHPRLQGRCNTNVIGQMR